VDTSLVRKAENGLLSCLSGRTLNVAAFEPAADGEYRVGVKRGYELMPKTLVSRTTSERQEKFEKLHRAHLNGLQAAFDDLQSKYMRVIDGEVVDVSQEMSEAEQATKAELSAQIEQCASLMSGWNDPNPLYDVVAWKAASDGEWRVIVDTTESGDVKKLRALKVFKESGDFSNFGSENMMNYSVNVWQGGSVVEIVVNAGGHGTHVAGIVGAYFGDGDVNNGVAPGCQMIGLKIGDSRLGSMETGTGLVRALIAARERKVDVINMSYGEPAAVANSGRIPELINELVHKHGILFITSASNSGPCLTTVGAPGANSIGPIAVAAVVSPSMMEQQYSMRDTTDRTLMPYNWSSRGPSLDGAYGPSIAAPGGAITSVPNWTLQKNQLMNGTSMASPNAAGCVALLLSALKQSHAQYSPSLVRLAIENSAKQLPGYDFTAVGHGVLQVGAAFDFYMAHCCALSPRVRIAASVPNRGKGRGIILRDTDHFFFPEIEEMIDVEPFFVEDTPSEEKIAFDMRLELRATVPWISTPKYFQLPNGGRSFKVHIRPPHLPSDRKNEGAYYLGEIQGFDMAHPELGPIFKVPVTVIRGAEVSGGGGAGLFGRHTFEYTDLPTGPGTLYRRFYQVPLGATWATITMNTKGWPFARMALLACQQVIPDQSHKFSLVDKYFSMKGDDERVVRVPLLAGLTFEVVVGQLWSAIGSEGSLSFSVEFNGVSVEGGFSASSFGEIQRLRIQNSLGTNVVQLKPTLCAVSRTLLPSNVPTITPLHKDRDLLTAERLIYQMVITYSYTVEEANVKVLIRSPFSTLLYDNPFESQLIMVYDSNKSLITTVDYNPEWFTLPAKGSFKLRMQLRHDDVSVLEKFKSLAIKIERQISKTVSLNVWSSLSAAIGGGKKFSADGVKYTTQAHFPIYIQAPTAASQLPSYVKHGDVMYGYMSLAKLKDQKDSYIADSGLDPNAVAVVPIQFVVPHKGSSSAASSWAATAQSGPGVPLVIQSPVALPPTAAAAAAPRPSAVVPQVSAPPPIPVVEVLSTSSTPAPSPAVSSPPTPAVPESPSPYAITNAPTTTSGSSSNNNQGTPAKTPQASSSSPSSSSASSSKPKAIELLLNSAVTHLWSLAGAEKWEEWSAREAEFAVILTTLREDIEIKLQRMLYCDSVFLKSAAASGGIAQDAARVDLQNAVDNLLEDIDRTALAVYWGTRHPGEAPSERQRQESLASKLVAGLARKARTLVRVPEEFPSIVAEIAKWTDPVPILQALNVQATASASSNQPPQHAIALRALRKKIPSGEKPSQAQSLEIITLLKALGWSHWVQHFQEWHQLRFAMSYLPF